MTQLHKALEFATQKHAGQVRKGSGKPYVTHPISVSDLVKEYKDSKKLDDLVVAALLHDVLEDTNTTFEEIAITFTPLVASLVLEVTNDSESISKIGKLEYQKKKVEGISNYGLLIKLADRLHNITDNPTYKMLTDTMELMGHLISNRNLSDTHNALVFDIQSVCKFKTNFINVA